MINISISVEKARHYLTCLDDFEDGVKSFEVWQKSKELLNQEDEKEKEKQKEKQSEIDFVNTPIMEFITLMRKEVNAIS